MKERWSSVHFLHKHREPEENLPEQVGSWLAPVLREQVGRTN